MEKNSLLDIILSVLKGLLSPAVKPPLDLPPTTQEVAKSPAEWGGFYLTSSQVAKIEEFFPIYEWAVYKIHTQNIPWQALAALHYREADFAKYSKIPGGVFQLDPGGEGSDLRSRIDMKAMQTCIKYSVNYQSIETDFSVAAIVAVDELLSKLRGDIRNPDGSVNRDVLADAFWGYNGRSDWHTPDGSKNSETKGWRYSCYVSNDPKRGVQLRIKGTMPSPDGKTRVRIDKDDKQIGAIIIFDEICKRVSHV